MGAPPASQHATAESAATLNWLAKTNLMWTSNDFSPLDQVTTGAARTAYLAQERATTSAPAPGSRTPFQLTSLSITVPCHQGAEAVFVAYGDTEPFSTWLCLADLQGVDGLGELAGAPGAAAELAEDAPGFELRVCPLGGCAEFRVGPVGLVVEWEVPDASERNTPPQVSYYEPAIVDGALLMEFTSRTESSKPKVAALSSSTLHLKLPNGQQELFSFAYQLIQYIQTIHASLLGGLVRDETIPDF